MKAGKLQCLSDHNLAKKIPNKQKDIKYREKEIYTILERILIQNEKMVVINGLRGIGKSSLAKIVMHFLSERKLCTGGNIYIECKNAKDIFALLKTI